MKKDITTPKLSEADVQARLEDLENTLSVLAKLYHTFSHWRKELLDAEVPDREEVEN